MSSDERIRVSAQFAKAVAFGLGVRSFRFTLRETLAMGECALSNCHATLVARGIQRRSRRMRGELSHSSVRPLW